MCVEDSNLITQNFDFPIDWNLCKWSLPYLPKLCTSFMSCNNDIVRSDRREVFLLPLLYRVFPISINLNHNSMILSSPCWPEMDRSQLVFKIVYLWDAN